MKYSHFYTVDQWDLRDVDLYWRGVSRKQMYHKPCDKTVCKATTGTRWVCIGCYTEPPEEIKDVMLLADVWKGWDDPIEPTYRRAGGTVSFYMGALLPNVGDNSNWSFFYTPLAFNSNTKFTLGGNGNFFGDDPHALPNNSSDRIRWDKDGNLI